MSARSDILDREIRAHAMQMGGFHGPRFAEACRKALTHATALATVSENDIASAVAVYANDYMDGAASERARILEIDSVAAQAPASVAALAKKAKAEGLTADEFSVQALNSCRQFSHAMPARKQ